MENNNLAKPSARKYFWGSLRALVGKLIPETSSLYKFLYLNGLRFQATQRNRMQKDALSFQFKIMDGCNLNCAGCNTYSPLCESELQGEDLVVFERDLKRMVELTAGNVGRIWFTGGEPLLHPDIMQVLDLTRSYVPNSEVMLITNGVLLTKQQDVFWQCCNKNKIKIYITPYPIKLKWDEILETADKWKVDLEYFYSGGKETFRKTPLNIEGSGKDIVRNFNRCSSSNTCNTIKDGKMYACAQVASIEILNKYFGLDFKVSSKDYIDIHKANTKEEVAEFICNPVPFCKYCDMDKMEFGIPWGVSRKDRSEWM